VTATQNPLVAQYTAYLFGNGRMWVEFGPDTSYGKQTSSTPSTGSIPNNSAKVLVAGMKPSTMYHMRAHIDWPDGTSWVDQDQTFTTGALPTSNGITLTITRPAQAATTANDPQSGVELLDLINPDTNAHQAFATDLDGNVIWFYDINVAGGALPLKPLSNGHMLANIASSSTLRESDLADNTVRELTATQLTQMLQARGFAITINQFHHDMLPLPNGHTILLTNTIVPYSNLAGYPGTTDVIGDVLVDLDQRWRPVWVWSAFDHLDVNRHLQGLPDWTHSNALVYTPGDGNLLLSIRHQSWIIKIDYANGTGTGNILWKLGEGGDFSLSGGDPSQWFYAQHYPNLLQSNGSQMSLAIFDNGNFRVLDGSGTECGLAPLCYSRATIFQIDEAARTANLIWEYSPGVFSSWGGSIGVVENGNVEFDMSAPFGFVPRSRITEVTQDATAAVVWQMDINGANAYRAYRIPSLYPGVTWTH
jgi:arylsulfate sulfotransferase